MAIIKIRNAAIDLDAAEIPNLPATKITSGTFANNKLTGSGAITINGSSVALGASTTIATGLSWQSTIVTASTLTAVSGNGYWINTTSNACTITLPSNPSLGDEIVFVDYARNWGTNAITINQNSKKFQGNTSPNPVYNSNGQSVSIVYSDATKGWIPTVDDDVSNETPQLVDVQYLVVAGGGAGGAYYGGGGGAGGLLTSTLSNLAKGVTLTATVGAGGASVIINSGAGVKGNNGVNSSLAGSGLTTVTAAGGGGAGANSTLAGNSGGSGGGGSPPGNGGSGTVGQGNNGGTAVSAAPDYGAAGGGGAGAVGGSADNTAGSGGVGVSNSITGSAVFYAGGGGGSSEETASGGAGGNGGGGASGDSGSEAATAGTVNTGGGGGGSNQAQASGAGGSGVVILSVPDASYSGTTTGSPTVATGVSGKTIITFTGNGTYVT